jgi:subtilisin family serine protease
MKTKIFTLLLTLISTVGLFAQKNQLPREYWKQYRAEKKEFRQERKEHDVVLQPIEQIPVTPRDLEVANTGNWGIQYLQADQNELAIASRAKRKVLVYIFDTASDYDHRSLQAAKWEGKGRIFTDESAGLDKNGHSTHCAGIIGAVDGNNIPVGIGKALVNKGLLKIIPYKVLSDAGSGSYSWIANGTNAAVDEAIKLQKEGWFVVFSYSLGGSSGSTIVDAALKRAEQAGIFVVAASGNTSQKGVNYPGSSKSAKAIAALEQVAEGSAKRAYYSTTGPEVWTAAPGSDILSTYPGQVYRKLSGTSMATPHVAGVVAILASVFEKATAAQLASYIEKKAIDLSPTGRDEETGFGAPILTALLAGDPYGENPDNPNPDPIDPNPPVRENRLLQLDLDGPFSMPWSAGANQSSAVNMLKLSSREKKAFATKNDVIKVQRIWCQVNSKTSFELEYDKFAQLTQEYFTNRGLWLTPESDAADAAKWTKYFYEMLLKRDSKYEFVSIRFDCVDAKGRKISF